MPIYAYRCESCGHQKDVLQKISDAPLTVCPACQAQAFKKQLTAPGFQLKGSGWYATDFKGGAASTAPAAGPAAGAASTAAASESPAPSSQTASSAHACGTGGCPAC